MTSTSLYYTGYEMTEKELNYEIAKKHFINDQKNLIPEEVQIEFSRLEKEYNKIDTEQTNIYKEIKKAKGKENKEKREQLKNIEDSLILRKYKLINAKSEIIKKYPFIDRVKAQEEFFKMIDNNIIKYYRGKIIFA